MKKSAARLSQSEINRSVLEAAHDIEAIGARTRRGGAIALVSQWYRLGLQLVGTFLLSRLLEPGDFGLIAMGQTMMAFIGVFTDLSLPAATIQRRDLDQQTASGLLWIGVGIALVSVLAAFAFSPLAVWLFKDERVAAIVWGFALAAPFNALGGQHAALLRRNMRWLEAEIVGSATYTTGILAAVLAAWLLNWGYWSLVAQAWASVITGVVLAWTFCPWRPSWVRDWSGARSALGFTVNLTGKSIVAFFGQQIDKILVGWRWGASDLGFFARAQTLLAVPFAFVSGPISATMIPALSRLQHEPARWREAYLDSLAIVAIATSALAALMFGSADLAVEIALGPGWGETADIFSALALVLLATTPLTSVEWIYVSLGRSGRLLKWTLMWTPFSLLAIVLGLQHGPVGVALATSLSTTVAVAPALWFATRDTSLSFADPFKMIAPPIVAAIVVGLGLRAMAPHLGFWAEFAMLAVAGCLFLALIGAALWFWPPYARVRSRMVTMSQQGVGVVRGWLRRKA